MIFDIEFRWLKKKTKIPGLLDNIYSDETVLQVRKLQKDRNGEAWTDWADVPTYQFSAETSAKRDNE